MPVPSSISAAVAAAALSNKPARIPKQPTIDVQKQPPPLPVVNDEIIKARAAAARAYALGGGPSTDFQTPVIVTAAAAASSRNAATISARQQQPQQQQAQQQQQQQQFIPNVQDDDYALFVKCLVDDEFFKSLPPEDEADDFLLPEDDDDDEDDDDEFDDDILLDDSLLSPASSTPKPASWGDDDDEPFTLEAELGLLLEEDLEAAVTTLLSQHPPTPSENSNKNTSTPAVGNTPGGGGSLSNSTLPRTPLREAASQSKNQNVVTAEQRERLSSFLQRHYQLLVQQSALCVRAAHASSTSNLSTNKAGASTTVISESPEDLAEILDGAVGMLQDLDENRKDAIRTSIQLQQAKSSSSSSRATSTALARSSFPNSNTDNSGRLTRAAFTKTLLEQANQYDPNHDGSSTYYNHNIGANGTTTLFAIAGLARLKHTFLTLDNTNLIVEQPTAQDACRLLLEEACGGGGGSSSNASSTTAAATASSTTITTTTTLAQKKNTADTNPVTNRNWDASWLPGARDFTELLSQPKEVFGENFQGPPLSWEQALALKRDRNQFTAAEDSLVFRGVNLYGEKQWLLIADRYLPDRSINIISQRYSKLSLLLYRAHGIKIDSEGNLEHPPKHESVDKLDEGTLKYLKKVDPPAILNVHRWSIEEDLCLLRAVPILGHMWAELSTRLVPHRNRGHLRKRYQVLERRVKATVARANKEGRQKQAAPQRQPPHFLKKRKVLAPEAVLNPSHAHHRQYNQQLQHQMQPQQQNQPPQGPPAHAPTARQHRYEQPPPRTSPTPTAKPTNLSLCKQGNNVPASHQPHLHPDQPSHPGQLPPALNTGASRSGHPVINPPCGVIPNQFDDSERDESRMGFERMLNNEDTEWSQLSRVNKMMGESDSSMMGVNKLAHAAAAAEALERMNSDLGHIPHPGQYSNGFDSRDGLSMLADGAGDNHDVSSSLMSRAPLLGAVLERTQHRDDSSRLSAVGSMAARTPSSSPSKLRGFPSPNFKTGSMGLPPFKSSPTGGTNSNIMWGSAGDDTSYHFEGSHGFDISDRSRQVFGSPTKQSSGLGTGTGLTPTKTSRSSMLMVGLDANSRDNNNNDNNTSSSVGADEGTATTETEKTAIWALTGLSNSPARFGADPSKKPASRTGDSHSNKFSNMGGVKRSLFDKVVTEADKNSKKKRKY